MFNESNYINEEIELCINSNWSTHNLSDQIISNEETSFQFHPVVQYATKTGQTKLISVQLRNKSGIFFVEMKCI
jgi:hypothetical protein